MLLSGAVLLLNSTCIVELAWQTFLWRFTDQASRTCGFSFMQAGLCTRSSKGQTPRSPLKTPLLPYLLLLLRIPSAQPRVDKPSVSQGRALRPLLERALWPEVRKRTIVASKTGRKNCDGFCP